MTEETFGLILLAWLLFGMIVVIIIRRQPDGEMGDGSFLFASVFWPLAIGMYLTVREPRKKLRKCPYCKGAGKVTP